jgi:hypothetical protein
MNHAWSNIFNYRIYGPYNCWFEKRVLMRGNHTVTRNSFTTVKNVGNLINLVKIEITGGFILSTIQDVLVADASGELIPARGLAKVLGRIAALRISHGNITQIMTRNLQHRLGWIVNTQGWEASLKLRGVDREELS